MICTDVLVLFYPAGSGALAELARNRRLAGHMRWGGWGSNPRPADYEKYGPHESYALPAQMTRIIALTALNTLG